MRLGKVILIETSRLIVLATERREKQTRFDELFGFTYRVKCKLGRRAPKRRCNRNEVAVYKQGERERER